MTKKFLLGLIFGLVSSVILCVTCAQATVNLSATIYSQIKTADNDIAQMQEMFRPDSTSEIKPDMIPTVTKALLKDYMWYLSRAMDWTEVAADEGRGNVDDELNAIAKSTAKDIGELSSLDGLNSFPESAKKDLQIAIDVTNQVINRQQTLAQIMGVTL